MTLNDLKNIKEIRNLKASCQASFYGKAKTVFTDDGEIYLLSYQTLVAKIKDGKFFRLWNGYSDTTKKHINDFCSLFGFSGFSKKEWLQLPCVNSTGEHWKVYGYNGFSEFTSPTLFDSYEQAENYANDLNGRQKNNNFRWFYEPIEA